MSRIVMNGFATHQAVLLYAAMNSAGPIAEVGAGYYSTPLLHVVAHKMKRPLVTYDSSAEWLEQFRAFATPRHKLQVVEDWDAVDFKRAWGLAFIDHGPMERRRHEIMRLRCYATIVIAHDTNLPGIANETKKFKHRIRFNAFGGPWTDVCSDRHDVTQWRGIPFMLP